LKSPVEEDGKKCGESVSSARSWYLQAHLQNAHKELYAKIQASLKLTDSLNQLSLTGFEFATPGKSSGAVRDLQMFYANFDSIN
jgi:hypothetical protein